MHTSIARTLAAGTIILASVDAFPDPIAYYSNEGPSAAGSLVQPTDTPSLPLSNPAQPGPSSGPYILGRDLEDRPISAAAAPSFFVPGAVANLQQRYRPPPLLLLVE